MCNFRNFLFAFVAIILIVGLAKFPGRAYATPTYNGIIGLSPAQITVSPGQTFSISVDVYDNEVDYNSASISISLGSGLTFAGADYTNSAFDTPGIAQVEQGKYGSCLVLSRSSTTILTGTNHLANILFHVPSGSAYPGGVIEQDWTDCGSSSDIYLNGQQANQGAEEGGEVFVDPTPNTLPTASTITTPSSSRVANLPAQTSNKSTPTATPKPSNSPVLNKPETTATAVSEIAAPSPTLKSSHFSVSKIPATTRLASVSKSDRSPSIIILVAGLVLILAVASFLYIRSKRAKRLA
jgi:hypothetical protein